MKKSNLMKVFSILLISVMVIAMCNATVLAADNTNGFSDLTNTITGNNTNSNNSSSNSNSSNSNSNSSNNSNTNRSHSNNTNNSSNSNNSSVYNNTNLPKTGIEDSIPVAMLVVVFGISAVYAYRKIKEYRNI